MTTTTLTAAKTTTTATRQPARHRDNTRPVKQGFRLFRKGAHVAPRA